MTEADVTLDSGSYQLFPMRRPQSVPPTLEVAFIRQLWGEVKDVTKSQMPEQACEFSRPLTKLPWLAKALRPCLTTNESIQVGAIQFIGRYEKGENQFAARPECCGKAQH